MLGLIRQGCLVAVGIAVAIPLGGCGGSQGADAGTTAAPAPPVPREVSVTLDGALSPANAAIRVAEQQGFFDDLGLTVSANSPLAPNRPPKYVASSVDDIGLMQEPQLLIAKQKGAPLVAVGSLVSQPTAAMIWLKGSKIRGIGDLAGGTIAVPGIPYQEDLLESVLARAGLTSRDVKILRAPYELVPTLLGGKADAIFGGSWNVEGVALRKRGAKPVIRPMQSLGVPAYDEIMVVTRTDWAAEESKTVRDFMTAVNRGAALVSKDPDAAVEAIEEFTSATPHAELEAQARATAPLLSRTGRIDPERERRLASWMHAQGMIAREPSFAEAFTSEYLPSG